MNIGVVKEPSPPGKREAAAPPPTAPALGLPGGVELSAVMLIKCDLINCEDKLSLLSCGLSLDSAFSLLASTHTVDPSKSISLQPSTGPC